MKPRDHRQLQNIGGMDGYGYREQIGEIVPFSEATAKNSELGELLKYLISNSLVKNAYLIISVNCQRLASYLSFKINEKEQMNRSR